jgi:hypothetical protein
VDLVCHFGLREAFLQKPGLWLLVICETLKLL